MSEERQPEGGGSAVRAPGRRRAADSPVDASPERAGERKPRARARDREALRAHKPLAAEDRKPQQQQQTQLQSRQPPAAGQHQQQVPPPNDPSAAHNLAMVTPLEFVHVPGREHPVMQPPPTSHIPVVTSAAVRPVAGPATAGAGGAGTDSAGEIVPVGAHTAHGLEPLDSMTGGLARVNRLRLIQTLVVALGAIAIAVGLIMIMGS
ncbi:hypothetical protein [Arthrobacter castelli]|uniref:hypothetical protein n=1 Tax=Arthrobacter castelli TaxID=271431 RepID=UPI0003F87F95|nr:hypothetical protein [Arthrobacter castelli]